MNDSAAPVTPVEKPAKTKKVAVVSSNETVALIANILANSAHVTNGTGAESVGIPTKYAGVKAYIDIPAGATVDIRTSTKASGKMTGVAGMTAEGATAIGIAHGELVVSLSGPRTVFHGDVVGHANVTVEAQADDN